MLSAQVFCRPISRRQRVHVLSCLTVAAHVFLSNAVRVKVEAMTLRKVYDTESKFEVNLNGTLADNEANAASRDLSTRTEAIIEQKTNVDALLEGVTGSSDTAWLHGTPDASKHGLSVRKLDWFVSNFEHICSGLFAVMVCWCLKSWAQTVGDGSKNVSDIRRQREALQKTCLNAVSGMKLLLAEMAKSPVHSMEEDLRDKRKEFVMFLKRVREKLKLKHGDGELLKPFRRFVVLWLEVYEQCTDDPVQRPARIVSQEEAEQCTSIADIAELVSQRLEGHEMKLIKHWEKFADNEEFRIWNVEIETPSWVDCSCWCNLGWGVRSPLSSQGITYPMDLLCGCLRISILCRAHIWFLITLTFGLFAGALNLTKGSVYPFTAVVCAEALLLVLLSRIGDVAECSRLQAEAQQLTQASKDAQKEHENLRALAANLKNLNQLFSFRTVPCLELLEVLHENVLKLSDKEELYLFLSGVNEKLVHVFKGMGPLCLWSGDSAVSNEFLKLSAEQLRVCAQYVDRRRGDASAIPSILIRLGTYFGYLKIRILSANNLPHKGGLGVIFDVANPYVVVSIGTKESYRSPTVRNALSPKWGNAEWNTSTSGEDSVATLQVWSDLLGTADDRSLGIVEFDFRAESHGEWHSRCEQLFSAKNRNPKEGAVIEFEYFFASEFQQLSNVPSLNLADFVTSLPTEVSRAGPGTTSASNSFDSSSKGK